MQRKSDRQQPISKTNTYVNCDQSSSKEQPQVSKQNKSFEIQKQSQPRSRFLMQNKFSNPQEILNSDRKERKDIQLIGEKQKQQQRVMSNERNLVKKQQSVQKQSQEKITKQRPKSTHGRSQSSEIFKKGQKMQQKQAENSISQGDSNIQAKLDFSKEDTKDLINNSAFNDENIEPLYFQKWGELENEPIFNLQLEAEQQQEATDSNKIINTDNSDNKHEIAKKIELLNKQILKFQKETQMLTKIRKNNEQLQQFLNKQYQNLQKDKENVIKMVIQKELKAQRPLTKQEKDHQLKQKTQPQKTSSRHEYQNLQQEYLNLESKYVYEKQKWNSQIQRQKIKIQNLEKKNKDMENQIQQISQRLKLYQNSHHIKSQFNETSRWEFSRDSPFPKKFTQYSTEKPSYQFSNIDNSDQEEEIQQIFSKKLNVNQITQQDKQQMEIQQQIKEKKVLSNFESISEVKFQETNEVQSTNQQNSQIKNASKDGSSLQDTIKEIQNDINFGYYKNIKQEDENQKKDSNLQESQHQILQGSQNEKNQAYRESRKSSQAEMNQSLEQLEIDYQKDIQQDKPQVFEISEQFSQQQETKRDISQNSQQKQIQPQEKKDITGNQQKQKDKFIELKESINSIQNISIIESNLSAQSKEEFNTDLQMRDINQIKGPQKKE